MKLEYTSVLNNMLKAMEKIDKVNTERNDKFYTLMQISLGQQQTNMEQLKYIEDLLMKAVLKESLHEDECRRSAELSER